MMPDIDQNEMKEAVKSALKEWLDEKYAEFGKWSFKGLVAAALVGMVYFAIQRYIPR